MRNARSSRIAIAVMVPGSSSVLMPLWPRREFSSAVRFSSPRGKNRNNTTISGSACKNKMPVNRAGRQKPAALSRKRAMHAQISKNTARHQSVRGSELSRMTMQRHKTSR